MDTREKIIDYIMTSFAGIYTRRFTSFLDASEYNENMFRREWSLALEGITSEEVEYAVSIFRRRDDKFPPTPGEFVRVALQIPSAQTIANGGGGELGRWIRNQIGDSFTLQRMSAYDRVNAVKSIYRDEADEYIDSHLENRKMNCPEAIGYQNDQAILPGKEGS